MGLGVAQALDRCLLGDQRPRLLFFFHSPFSSTGSGVHVCLGEKCVCIIFMMGSDLCVKVQALRRSSFAFFPLLFIIPHGGYHLTISRLTYEAVRWPSLLPVLRDGWKSRTSEHKKHTGGSPKAHHPLQPPGWGAQSRQMLGCGRQSR